jgi:hypothetical protein
MYEHLYQYLQGAIPQSDIEVLRQAGNSPWEENAQKFKELHSPQAIKALQDIIRAQHCYDEARFDVL